MSRSFLKKLSNLLGFYKDSDSPSNSEDDDDWGDSHPRLTMIMELLELAFSDIKLQKDSQFRNEIAKSEERWVPVDYLLNFNKFKVIEASASELLEAANESQYLDADKANSLIRSKTPYEYDPTLYARVLKITGIGKRVPQSEQMEFYQSIFHGQVQRVFICRKEENGNLDNTGSSLVQFATIEQTKEVLENGIEYGSKLLDIEQYQPKYKNHNEEQMIDEEADDERPETPRRGRKKGQRGRSAKPKIAE